MITRRQFLKLGMAGTALVLTTQVGGARRVVYAQVQGGTLLPGAVPKFVTPLLIPPAMPRTRRLNVKGGKNIDYYEIAVRQFQQQILPPDMPMTTVWGYGPAAAPRGSPLFNAPSLTLEAKANTPVRVKWVNELVDEGGTFLPHLLPVDRTLHWANPPGGTAGRDTRPTFERTPDPYTGPVPLVTHVHGAIGVGDESDGYAEAWYLPAAAGLSGYATEGSWYARFKAKAEGKLGASWGPGFAIFEYPNAQRAATLWYHDHTLGMTRLNVYAGPAGFFIIRGGSQGDKAVIDTRTQTPAVLPGPAPALGDAPGTAYYEIPIAIQDRSFTTDGALFYPDTRAFFDGITGGYIPETDIAPIWNPEFFGNCIMVNGATWPYLDVERRRYRFRVLNGCNSRFLILDFASIPGVEVWQIGNEGGLLAAPVNLTGTNGNRLLMAPAERADLIVDFTGVAAGDYILANVGPDEPFGGGIPGEDFDRADPASTGQIMAFRVGRAVVADPTTPPQSLQLPAIVQLAGGAPRQLALLEKMSEDFDDAPAEAMLGTVAGGEATHRMWSDDVTESPAAGATEVWEFYNFTADAHPIHIHEVHFQVVDRQAISFQEGEMGHIHAVQTSGTPRAPEPWESGWKDTVIAYPAEVTRVRMRFEQPGQFVWHCHIVEHEDNEMMRPFTIRAPSTL